MRATSPLFLFPLLLAATPVAADGPSGTECWPGVIPGGSLPNQQPAVFCSIVGGGPATAD